MMIMEKTNNEAKKISQLSCTLGELLEHSLKQDALMRSSCVLKEMGR